MSAPPVPATGLPAGWDMTQWEWYGAEYLQRTQAAQPQPLAPAPIEQPPQQYQPQYHPPHQQQPPQQYQPASQHNPYKEAEQYNPYYQPAAAPVLTTEEKIQQKVQKIQQELKVKQQRQQQPPPQQAPPPQQQPPPQHQFQPQYNPHSQQPPLHWQQVPPHSQPVPAPQAPAQSPEAMLAQYQAQIEALQQQVQSLQSIPLHAQPQAQSQPPYQPPHQPQQYNPHMPYQPAPAPVLSTEQKIQQKVQQIQYDLQQKRLEKQHQEYLQDQQKQQALQKQYQSQFRPAGAPAVPGAPAVAGAPTASPTSATGTYTPPSAEHPAGQYTPAAAGVTYAAPLYTAPTAEDIEREQNLHQQQLYEYHQYNQAQMYAQSQPAPEPLRLSFPTTPVASNEIIMEMWGPDQAMGYLIGKGGNDIREINALAGVVISVGPTGDLNERGERRITIRGATQAHNDHAKGLIESRMAAYEPKHKPGDGAPGAPMLVLKLRVPDLTPEQKDALVAESQRFQLGKCKECNATLLESSMAEHVASECKMGDLDSGFDDRAQANKTRDQEKASQDRALAREQEKKQENGTADPNAPVVKRPVSLRCMQCERTVSNRGLLVSGVKNVQCPEALVELGEKEVPWAAAQQENKESRAYTLRRSDVEREREEARKKRDGERIQVIQKMQWVAKGTLTSPDGVTFTEGTNAASTTTPIFAAVVPDPASAKDKSPERKRSSSPSRKGGKRSPSSGRKSNRNRPARRERGRSRHRSRSRSSSSSGSDSRSSSGSRSRSRGKKSKKGNKGRSRSKDSKKEKKSDKDKKEKDEGTNGVKKEEEKDGTKEGGGEKKGETSAKKDDTTSVKKEDSKAEAEGKEMEMGTPLPGMDSYEENAPAKEKSKGKGALGLVSYGYEEVEEDKEKELTKADRGVTVKSEEGVNEKEAPETDTQTNKEDVKAVVKEGYGKGTSAADVDGLPLQAAPVLPVPPAPAASPLLPSRAQALGTMAKPDFSIKMTHKEQPAAALPPPPPPASADSAKGRDNRSSRSSSRSSSSSSSRSRSRSRGRKRKRSKRSRSRSGSNDPKGFSAMRKRQERKNSRSRSRGRPQKRSRSRSREKPAPPEGRPISSENKGAKLLKLMGWSGKGGLGKTEQGRDQPVFAEQRVGNNTGIGHGAKNGR